jgi:predicted O-linked N-acetylglucosamine transferase (SPINDLY family)
MSQLTIEQSFGLALQHHQAGQFAQAEQIYRQILSRDPAHADALHYLGLLAHQMGRSDIAVDLISRAVAVRPSYAEAFYNLGIALKAKGDWAQAIAAYRQAIALRPDDGEAYNNLGVVLKDQGKLEEAIAVYRQAIALKTEFPAALNNLGNALKEKGELPQAIAAYRQAIAMRPGYADAHNNLGAALRETGDLDQAIAEYHQAISLKPANAEAFYNLGIASREQGRLDASAAALRQAIGLRSDYLDAYINLATTLKEQGQLDDALAVAKRAVALKPDSPDAHNKLGMVLKDRRQFQESAAAYRQAIALRPNYAEAYNNLGVVLTLISDVDAAVTACRKAIELNPNLPEAYCNLGNILKDLGVLDDAIAAYRHAIELRPDLAVAHNNLVFLPQYHPGYDARAIAEEQRRFNRQFAEPLKKFIQPHANNRDPDRRLRIGYVSADFLAHASANFLLPLFGNHDSKRVEIFCYAEVARPDEISERFKKLGQWRPTVGLSDEAVAKQIREDQIDILVDLKIHTAGNRLLVFARKPAPVQITWLGQPGSTGLTTIDYRLGDPYLDPPGMDESIYSEKTIRLPETFWCYDPLDERDIPVNELPAIQNNFITFGCLNNFCKINEPHLKFMAKILGQTPSSRLMLLADPGSHRQRIFDRFQAEGIDADRIEFIPRQSRRNYLKAYHRIDISLDSFPYNGHTTSLDSFWMGVPVVTLVGQTAVSRAGWCQLSNLGLPQLAGNTPDEFVNIAINLASDLPKLKELRAALRPMMEKSPLMDAPRFAKNIENIFRQIWRAYLSQHLANESIDAPESLPITPAD